MKPAAWRFRIPGREAWRVTDDAVLIEAMSSHWEIVPLFPCRTLTDEAIAELWHKNGGFHHHFARAVERWLKEQQ